LDATEGGQDAGFARARAGFELLLGSNDKREGIAAFREKRRPTFNGD
jgi:enoyl-CoA hydratase/carnithine racemase